jgi:NAD(P)-dependent dehydrogenase (short-subunit alcohol dehydrogenase family)
MSVNRLLRESAKKCLIMNLSRTGRPRHRQHEIRKLTVRGEHYKINTASYHFTTFAFLPLLSAAKSVGNYPEPGNIINLSSMSGITKTSQRGQFSYNASKAATILLSKMQATEFARRNLGIRVNCVCPGYFPSVCALHADTTASDGYRVCRYSIPKSARRNSGVTGVSRSDELVELSITLSASLASLL